jgi:hypothetical protein
VKGSGVEAFSRSCHPHLDHPEGVGEEIGGRDDQRTFLRASYSMRCEVRRSVVLSENVPWERGGTSFEDYTAKDKPSGNAN